MSNANMINISDWEDWEIDQRIHAVKSLIKAYAEMTDRSHRQLVKLRRYQREFQYLTAEMQSRTTPTVPVQLVLFELE